MMGQSGNIVIRQGDWEHRFYGTEPPVRGAKFAPEIRPQSRQRHQVKPC